jgi:hypothetical protein
MARDDGGFAQYPCLQPKPGLRRVHEPRDERPAASNVLRQTVARLIDALRR